MSDLGSLTMIRPEDSFLRFGTWSVLLHVGAIALFGFLHIAHPIEEPMPLVTVTLLKPPPVQPPPMLRTEQPAAPQQLLPVQKQLRLPSQPTTNAMDIPPSPHAPRRSAGHTQNPLRPARRQRGETEKFHEAGPSPRHLVASPVNDIRHSHETGNIGGQPAGHTGCVKRVVGQPTQTGPALRAGGAPGITRSGAGTTH